MGKMARLLEPWDFLFLYPSGNYERMYQRLVKLEEKEEAMILSERIERIEKEPSAAVPFKEIRRSNK